MASLPTMSEDSYSTHALAVLKAKGFRITQPRRWVIEALDHATEALSPYDLKDLLDSQKQPVDTVSIYRILSCLEENGMAHRVLESGKYLKCHLPLEPEGHCHHHETTHHCHHFLVCVNCHQIEEVHCIAVEPVIETIETQTQFKIQRHQLEFYGLCPKCQKSSKSL